MPHDINMNYRTRLHNSKTNEEKFSLPPGFEPWSHGSIARVLSMSYGDPHEQQTLEDWKFFKVYFNQFLISIKIFTLNCILIQSIISLWPLIAEDEPRWYEPILWLEVLAITLIFKPLLFHAIKDYFILLRVLFHVPLMSKLRAHHFRKRSVIEGKLWC